MVAVLRRRERQTQFKLESQQVWATGVLGNKRSPEARRLVNRQTTLPCKACGTTQYSKLPYIESLQSTTTPNFLIYARP